MSFHTNENEKDRMMTIVPHLERAAQSRVAWIHHAAHCIGFQIRFENGYEIVFPINGIYEPSFIHHMVQKLEHECRYRNTPTYFEPGQIFSVTADSFSRMDYKMGIGMAASTSRHRTVPKCPSCGEEHTSKLDFRGRCDKNVKKFWDKVRKIYWHRYTKEPLLVRN